MLIPNNTLLSASLPPAYVVRREGNSFTLFVCPHGGGYPYPIMLCNISQNAMRQWGGVRVPPPGGGTQSGPGPGTPPGGFGYPPGGVPGQVPPPGGGTRSGPGTPWGGTRSGPGPGTPLGGVPGQVGGVPSQDNRRSTHYTAAVCLLRSRRRTFLYRIYKRFTSISTNRTQQHFFKKRPVKYFNV